MESFPSYLQVGRGDGQVIDSSIAEDLFSDMSSDLGTLSPHLPSSLGSPDYGTVYNQTSLPAGTPDQLAILEDSNGVGHSGMLGESYVPLSHPIPYTSTIHCDYYPTSLTHHHSFDVSVVAHGGSQSYHTRYLNLVFSDGAFQNVPSFQRPLPSFAVQTTINEMRYILSPHPSPQGGSLPNGGTVMSLAPAPLSGASSLTSVHLPLGAPATGNDSQSYRVRMPAHVPLRNVKAVCTQFHTVGYLQVDVHRTMSTRSALTPSSPLRRLGY